MKRILYLLILWLYAIPVLQAQHVEVLNDTVCDTEEYGVLRMELHGILTSAYITEQIPYHYDADFSNASDVLLNGVPIDIDDRYSDAIHIGFPFYFFGEEYESLVVGANGDIIFEPALGGTYDSWPIDATDLIPSTELPYDGGDYGSIMGAYHDIHPGRRTNTSQLKYELRGTAPNRKFIITFYEMPQFDCTNLTTSQQIILHEKDYSIEVHMRHKPVCMTWNDGLSVLGIQKDHAQCGYYPGDNTSPSSIVNRNTSVWEIDSTLNPEAWRFKPDINAEIVWFDANRDTIPGQHADTLVVPVDNNNGPYTCQITYYDCTGSATTEYAEGKLVIIPTPVIDLGDDQKRCEDETISLDATPQNMSAFPNPSDLQYEWYKDGQALGINSPQYDVNEPGTYRVEVTYNGCTTSDEVEIENYVNGICKVPNVITPNDDSKNDAFVLDYLNEKKGIKKIQIFNRWGHVVFEKENGYTDEWHGQSQNGSELPAASYYYVIQLKDGTNQTGWVYIIK